MKLSGYNNILTEASNLIDELYKREELQNEEEYRNALDKFHTQKVELPIIILEQLAFNARPKIEEHMLIVLNKSTHEDHLSQPLQTNNKLFEIAVPFSTGYTGTFNATNSNIKFYFAKSVTDETMQISILPSAYEIENLNIENKRVINDQGYFIEANYPFLIKS